MNKESIKNKISALEKKIKKLKEAAKRRQSITVNQLLNIRSGLREKCVKRNKITRGRQAVRR